MLFLLLVPSGTASCCRSAAHERSRHHLGRYGALRYEELEVAYRRCARRGRLSIERHETGALTCGNIIRADCPRLRSMSAAASVWAETRPETASRSCVFTILSAVAEADRNQLRPLSLVAHGGR